MFQPDRMCCAAHLAARSADFELVGALSLQKQSRCHAMTACDLGDECAG